MKKFKVVQIQEDRKFFWVIQGTDIRLPIETIDTDPEDGGRVATLNREQLIEVASHQYGKFLTALGFDWVKHPHMTDTPKRVSKMWIDDLARGCFSNPPKMTSFENDGKYKGMVVVRDIKVSSMCAHHNLPFIGKAHVAYIPGDTVIGLSKFNRVVDYISRKPTVQENITQEIHDYINEKAEGNLGVAVVIEAEHMCVACRGIKDEQSDTVTQILSKEFYNDAKTREEFYMLLRLKK